MSKTKKESKAVPSSAGATAAEAVHKLNPEIREAVKEAASGKKPAKKSSQALPPGVYVEAVLVSDISTGPNIRRAEITPENDPKLQELAENIRSVGILEPLLLREGKGKNRPHVVISGFRRLAAAKLVGREAVPAILYGGLSDKQALEIQLAENLHRVDLLPIEEATVYERMRVDLDYSFEEIALRTGKSQRHIHRYIKLLSLPEDVIGAINRGDISLAKAQILCSLPKAVIEQVTKRCDYMLIGGPAKDFEDYVQRNYINALDGKVPFDVTKQYKERGVLYPPCAECPHKSQLELFEEYVNENKCPCADCYNGKRRIAEEKRKKEAEKKRAEKAKNGEDGKTKKQEQQEERWKKEQEERDLKYRKELSVNKKKAEYYIERKVEKGVSVNDYFYMCGEDALNVWNEKDDAVLDELYVAHVGKNAEQLKKECTYDELFKAIAIYKIFNEIDDGCDDDIAKWIGCKECPEKLVKQWEKEAGVSALPKKVKNGGDDDEGDPDDA